MAQVRETKSVKLFVGILSAPAVDLTQVRARLESEFGPADSAAGPWRHTFTDYYRDEMGPSLLRSFVGFAGLIDPADLPGIKLRTNQLEAEFAREWAAPGVERPVNLDPGYVNDGKVVLATVKDFSHRVYLSRGIFAEVTLHWQAGDWRDQPWTFPDYRTEEYKAFLREQRRILREVRPSGPTPAKGQA